MYPLQALHSLQSGRLQAAQLQRLLGLFLRTEIFDVLSLSGTLLAGFRGYGGKAGLGLNRE
jgi:hypothetical protein